MFRVTLSELSSSTDESVVFAGALEESVEDEWVASEAAGHDSVVATWFVPGYGATNIPDTIIKGNNAIRALGAMSALIPPHHILMTMTGVDTLQLSNAIVVCTFDADGAIHRPQQTVDADLNVTVNCAALTGIHTVVCINRRTKSLTSRRFPRNKRHDISGDWDVIGYHASAGGVVGTPVSVKPHGSDTRVTFSRNWTSHDLTLCMVDVSFEATAISELHRSLRISGVYPFTIFDSAGEPLDLNLIRDGNDVLVDVSSINDTILVGIPAQVADLNTYHGIEDVLQVTEAAVDPTVVAEGDTTRTFPDGVTVLGKVYYLDENNAWAPTDPTVSTLQSVELYIAEGTRAAVDGMSVAALITNPAWDWTPNARLYMGANGVITETKPTADSNPGEVYRVVGFARTSKTAIFDGNRPGIKLVGEVSS